MADTESESIQLGGVRYCRADHPPGAWCRDVYPDVRYLPGEPMCLLLDRIVVLERERDEARTHAEQLRGRGRMPPSLWTFEWEPAMCKRRWHTKEK